MLLTRDDTRLIEIFKLLTFFNDLVLIVETDQLWKELTNRLTEYRCKYPKSTLNQRTTNAFIT